MCIKLIAGAAIMLAVSSCGFTQQGDLARQLIKEKGAQAYDEGLRNATWYVCNAASVGAVKRAYGASPELAEVYRKFCMTPGDAADVISTEEVEAQ